MANGITIHALTGDDITPDAWDAFFEFYMETGSRKWGRPYLTRSFYDEIGATMAKDVLLVSVKFPVGDDLPATDPSRANIAALTAAFEKRFGRRPNQFAAQTYDAIMLAKMAIEKGGTDKAKVRDALRGIKGYQGVGGTFNFAADRHSGLSKDDLVLLRYEGGRFRLADYK